MDSPILLSNYIELQNTIYIVKMNLEVKKKCLVIRPIVRTYTTPL